MNREQEEWGGSIKIDREISSVKYQRYLGKRHELWGFLILPLRKQLGK